MNLLIRTILELSVTNYATRGVQAPMRSNGYGKVNESLHLSKFSLCGLLVVSTIRSPLLSFLTVFISPEIPSNALLIAKGEIVEKVVFLVIWFNNQITRPWCWCLFSVRFEVVVEPMSFAE